MRSWPTRRIITKIIMEIRARHLQNTLLYHTATVSKRTRPQSEHHKPRYIKLFRLLLLSSSEP
jgi:hypothetical protein